jgi:exodeoxyribonuclease VII large subunit
LQGFLEHQKTRLRFLSEKTLARELIKRLRDGQQQIDMIRDSLGRVIAHRIDHCRRGLLHAARALQDRSPARELLLRRNRFTESERRLRELPPRLVEHAKQRFARTEALLRVLGPDATLRRGYSITTDAHGNLVRSAKAVKSKMTIRTRVTDGEFESEAR